jgi:hypothetical protein
MQGGKLIDGDAHRIAVVGDQIGQLARFERAKSIALGRSTVPHRPCNFGAVFGTIIVTTRQPETQDDPASS